MAFDGNDRLPRPPQLNIVLPKLQDIGEELQDWSSDEIQSQLPTNILLITANKHEFIACYKYMSPVKRSYLKTIGTVYFGQFGEQKRVALIKCAQGPTNSAITVKNAADILNPQVVLFVGICASMKPKAKLGDVLISAKLQTYDDKKVRADGKVEQRGVKPNVSRNMASLILSAAEGWQAPLEDLDNLEVEVHCDATMLSGSELVNNRQRRDELGECFRDALGLEMEGAGLYAAAHDLGTEWAVIKAVSDLADGSKEMTNDWQRFSSVMAASVVYNMFKYTAVLKDWPHYNKH
ncbi:5 -methylthioadenosine S-adenosylhomocysteine nucleosidase-like isoform X16 [Paramuricea clavata]|uniref:5 -methylthioadenosine S-adenosylhomocysteine nucleosidase-like isoform X16 n=1 Tax=Paramuricea clavata TaxID=317549 RepID=A0A6S7IJR8_PARCT|nr:5 -methylthioadenosine S-adenosylhomocysteine nucleosidase-like isoform X16 [Paramuricea clavata]